MILKGIYPPIPTPFQGDEVSYKELTRNLIRWNETGLSGYVVLGSNGENVHLSPWERLAVIETTRRAIPGDKKLIVGTGLPSTRATIEFTLQAVRRGADAVLVLSPSYYRTMMTDSALRAHYLAVAEASPVPILLYNVPKFTGLNLNPALVAELAEHPNIVGIKDSAGDIYQIAELVRIVPDDFSVLVGVGSLIYSGLTLGATGGVVALANVAPRECVAIADLCAHGRYLEARDIQLRLLPVNRAVTSRYGVGGLKAAMDMLGYYGGPPRAPLTYPSQGEIRDIRDTLLTAGLLSK